MRVEMGSYRGVKIGTMVCVVAIGMGSRGVGAAGPQGSVSASEHWAFQAVADPAVPEVKATSWPRTSVDRFVLARLEAAGLGPSARAEKGTLIRRATFDLTGLPPTPEEIAEFLADDSPEAYAKVVDRLLASPHYGERWGRLWLDVARYADNKGYVFFEEKNYPWAYTYRDWVVRAFNEDLPYDRFIVDQLAADQLELGADKGPLAAMGYLTLGGHFMNNVHDVIDDRIDVVTRGLLGLTVTCARCHDHKYDPITQKDYYALYGVFRSSAEPTVPPEFRSAPRSDEYETFAAELKVRRDRLHEFVERKYGEVVTGARQRAGEYLAAVYAFRNQPATDDFMLLAFEGELNPLVVLRWRTYLDRTKRDDPVWAAWHALAGLDEEEFAEKAPGVIARLSVGDDAASAINPLIAKALTEEPQSMSDVAEAYGKLFKRIRYEWEYELAWAAYKKCDPPECMADSSKEQLRLVLYGPVSPAAVPMAADYGFLSLLPDRPAQAEFQKLLKAVEQWCMKGPGAPPRAMVMVDADTPYEPHVFLRGNPNRSGEPVARRFVSFLDPKHERFTKGSGRLELAERIADPANPLTARVMVNRIWMHHFGRGLVTTPSDFGLRSDPPSHPQLLDHLATEFVRSGWSVKHLHRLIMLSATYQQASDDREEALHVDPENRLVWKMNRRRLDFEEMRDALLAASGKLDLSVGGPAVNLLGDGFVTRRTLYGFVDRMDLPNLYRTFDYPDPAATSPKRDTTTVTPQALYLMNNKFVMEAARGLALRADVAGLPDTASKVRRMYGLAFGREPTEAETELAEEYLRAEANEEQWARFAHALLMTNEFMFVD